MSGARLIEEERARQIQDWTAEHDDTDHADGSLLPAALIIAGEPMEGWKFRCEGPTWAFNLAEKYTDDQVRRLSIAGALLAAEIDRLIRAGHPLPGDGDFTLSEMVMSRLMTLGMDLDLATDDPFWKTRDFPETVQQKLLRARHYFMEAMRLALAEAERTEETG